MIKSQNIYLQTPCSLLNLSLSRNPFDYCLCLNLVPRSDVFLLLQVDVSEPTLLPIKMDSNVDDPSSRLVVENVPPLLFKMLPLSCIHTNQMEGGLTQCENSKKNFENSSLKCELQPRPWGPVTLFSIESDSPMKSALLFQVSSHHTSVGLHINTGR